jgi:ribosome-associated heat shock protein Hsp15
MTLTKVRLDRWLWAARFFKTRAQAKTAIEGGKVQLEGHNGKPSKEVCVGQQIVVRRNDELFEVEVTGLAERRGSATIAAMLYQETAESASRRAADQAQRKMERAGLRIPSTRPDKHARRALQKMKQIEAQK